MSLAQPLPLPLPLTAHALAAFAVGTRSSRSRSLSPDRLTLSGPTPINTAPPSISGDTEIGSRPPSPDLEKGKGDVESTVATSEFPEGGNQLVGYPSSTITWIGSVNLFLVFGTSLLSGMGFDRGYFRYQLAIGSTLWVFGMFMLSLSKTFVQIFLSQSICLGIGLGIMFGPVLSCVGTYFYQRRGLMIGICASGGAVGAIIFPILLNNLFITQGFAASVRIAAYIMAALLLLANLLMRPRQLPRKDRAPVLSLLGTFSQDPSMWLTCLGIFGAIIGLFVAMFYVQVFIRTHGASPTLATYSLPILNASAFFGRICVGLIADRIGAFNTIIPFTFAMGVSIFVLLGATTTGGTLAFLLIFGFASGAVISIMPSCFMALATDVSEIGVRSGVGFLFVAVAALIGSPLAGAILVAAKGNYLMPCIFAGGSTLLGGVSLVFARRTQAVRRGSPKV